MSSRFKGGSKYRHTIGADDKRENWYLDISPSTYGDDNPIAASGQWIAVAWNASGGGPVALIALSQLGKRETPPLLQGHSKRITTLEFDPFNDSRLATGSEDFSVKIWNIPEGLKENIVESKVTLTGHTNKITSIKFHPTASDIIATGSTDKTVRVWDLSTGTEKYQLSTGTGMIYSVDWNYDGSLIAVTSSDKKIRIWDPRSGKTTVEGNGHEGVKPSIVTWLGNTNRIATTGFSKMRERQFWLWDASNLAKPLKTSTIDSSTGVVFPYFDVDTNQLYLAGKGDTTVRVFEIGTSDPLITPGNSVVSKTIQQGVARLPKKNLDVMGCEINRILRLGTAEIVPCSFVVPRKSHREFPDDLFPNTAASTPALTSSQWLGGETKSPNLISLNPESQGVVWDQPAKSSTKEEAPVAPAPKITADDVELEPTQSAFRQPEPEVISKEVLATEATSDANYYIPKKLNIIRSSKFRNVFTKQYEKAQWYTNLKVKTTGMEGNPLQANAKYFGVPWTGSGGRLAVIPLKSTGKLPDSIGTIETGSDVMGFAFNPTNDDQVVAGLDSGSIRIYNVPDGLHLRERNFTEFVSELKGHSRRLTDVYYHPLSSEVLVSTAMDLTIKLWDLKAGSEKLSLSGFGDQIQSSTFNYNGSLLAATSKDLKLRIFDPRAGKVIAEAANHEAPKATRVSWLGDTDRIFSVGFNKQSNREFNLFDLRKFPNPIKNTNIDLGSGIYEPFYDEDLSLMMLVAMGDTTVKFYEFQDEEPYSYHCTDAKLPSQFLGIAKLPKTLCDIPEVEIAQFLKLSPDGAIEKVSLKVPRTKKELFQDDIFVPTRVRSSDVLTAGDWFGGKNGTPKTVSLQPAGMKSASDAPKVVRVVKKFESVERKEDAADIKNAVINRFYGTMQDHKGDKLPQDEQEGVDEDEWSD